MTDLRPAEVKRKKQARKQPSSPGDQIDISITAEVQIGGSKAWVKVGLSSTHRANETTDQATDRIADYVLTTVDDAIDKLKA